MLVDYWRSDVNKNKEGETGRSECEVTKTRYLEAEELREIWDLGWKSSFQNKLGHVVCVILTSSLRRFLQTGLPLFCGAQFRSIQLFLIAAPFSWLPHCGQPLSLFHSFLLLLFFKAGAAGYLQNDQFSASLSKLKIVCYIAMSLVATGLPFLYTHALVMTGDLERQEDL